MILNSTLAVQIRCMSVIGIACRVLIGNETTISAIRPKCLGMNKEQISPLSQGLIEKIEIFKISLWPHSKCSEDTIAYQKLVV